jgi:hypothetical protein
VAAVLGSVQAPALVCTARVNALLSGLARVVAGGARSSASTLSKESPLAAATVSLRFQEFNLA